MARCTFCNCQAIAQLGHDYCGDHLSRVDSPILIEMMPSTNIDLIKKFFLDCFGTEEPSFSLITRLYNKFPTIERGRWIEKLRKFSKSQEIYLSECFISWLIEGGE